VSITRTVLCCRRWSPESGEEGRGKKVERFQDPERQILGGYEFKKLKIKEGIEALLGLGRKKNNLGGEREKSCRDQTGGTSPSVQVKFFRRSLSSADTKKRFFIPWGEKTEGRGGLRSMAKWDLMENWCPPLKRGKKEG